LIGWRIALVRAEQQHQFDQVKKLADLQRFRAVQGHDWPDLDVLRHNGLPTHFVSSYESLFSTVATGRVDYLPLSLIEAWPVSKLRPALTVDSNIVLHYPAAIYYFVNPRNTALAEEVRRGLEASIADGSFDKLFYRHFAAAIKLARLEHRRVIELRNPLLPAATPLERKELWFKYDDATRRRLDLDTATPTTPHGQRQLAPLR
jgi:membrane-bound lytic murein transglycosylase MltF